MWWFPFSFLLFRGERKREDFETEWQQGLWKERDGGGEEIQIFADKKNKTFMIADRHPSPQLNLFHLPFFRCSFREVTYFPDMEYRKRYSLFAVHLLRLPNRNMIPTNALPLQTSLPKKMPATPTLSHTFCSSKVLLLLWRAPLPAAKLGLRGFRSEERNR